MEWDRADTVRCLSLVKHGLPRLWYYEFFPFDFKEMEKNWHEATLEKRNKFTRGNTSESMLSINKTTEEKDIPLCENDVCKGCSWNVTNRVLSFRSIRSLTVVISSRRNMNVIDCENGMQWQKSLRSIDMLWNKNNKSESNDSNSMT